MDNLGGSIGSVAIRPDRWGGRRTHPFVVGCGRDSSDLPASVGPSNCGLRFPTKHYQEIDSLSYKPEPVPGSKRRACPGAAVCVCATVGTIKLSRFYEVCQIRGASKQSQRTPTKQIYPFDREAPRITGSQAHGFHLASACSTGVTTTLFSDDRLIQGGTFYAGNQANNRSQQD